MGTRRIIPARAGQTNIESTLRYRRTDHPRACGANDHPTCGKVSENGSSPRVRGKHRMADALMAVPRIIPARAGQTCSGSGSRRAGTDHPRACGANAWSPAYGKQDAGSSPRVRGKRSRSCPPRTRRRIIPARAGQTPREWHQLIAGADHPRACGAN